LFHNKPEVLQLHQELLRKIIIIFWILSHMQHLNKLKKLIDYWLKSTIQMWCKQMVCMTLMLKSSEMLLKLIKFLVSKNRELHLISQENKIHICMTQQVRVTNNTKWIIDEISEIIEVWAREHNQQGDRMLNNVLLSSRPIEKNTMSTTSVITEVVSQEKIEDH